jgi:hypothetical protein
VPVRVDLIKAPAGFEDQRARWAANVDQAVEIVDEFASDHDWEAFAQEPFFDSVEIFATQDALWERIRVLSALPPDAKPPTDGLAAVLEERVLLAITPAEYGRIRPEYAHDGLAWTRLLAHELAHRLHERVAGGSDAMGPPWFLEGFAVVASGQRLGVELPNTASAARLLTRATKRGAYAAYERAVRFLMTKSTLPELVRRAARGELDTWLANLPE